MRKFFILLNVLILLHIVPGSAFYPGLPGNDTNSLNNPQQEGTKYGALAIERHNGYFYAWANDCQTLDEAERKAIAGCRSKGGDCSVVLSFSGSGCAAYRYCSGKLVGLGFGWGLATTREEADIIAKKEHNIRSYGMQSPNVSYGCNSPGSGPLKMIYNATDEITTLPGHEEDY